MVLQLMFEELFFCAKSDGELMAATEFALEVLLSVMQEQGLRIYPVAIRYASVSAQLATTVVSQKMWVEWLLIKLAFITN